jgi:hypothetical protein
MTHAKAQLPVRRAPLIPKSRVNAQAAMQITAAPFAGRAAQERRENMQKKSAIERGPHMGRSDLAVRIALLNQMQ